MLWRIRLQRDGQDEHMDRQDEKIDLVEIVVSFYLIYYRFRFHGQKQSSTCGLSTGSEVFLIFTTQLYSCSCK